MTGPSNSLIIKVVSRTLSGLIQIFAFYVIFHGHYSPGGGFQGGALLAASIILLRMTEGREGSQSEFKSSLATPLSATGALIFALIGFMAMLGGGPYLDLKFAPWPGLAPAGVRSLDILLIEVGVALAVMATLISIFDDLAEETPND
jgi:multicomponent Na+:H+ antiporter subunit B